MGPGYCAACQKYDCGRGGCGFSNKMCLLEPFCCGGVFGIFEKDKTKINAQAVLTYIEQKLEEAKERAKPKKAWEPKLGDKVDIHMESAHGIVVAISRDRGKCAVFNPDWEKAKGAVGYDLSGYSFSEGMPVPGYNYSHKDIFIRLLREREEK